MTTIQNVSFGCDPEALIYDVGLEQFVPGDFVFRGDKRNHIPIGKGCHIHADGVAVEITTEPLALETPKFTDNFLIMRNHSITHIIKNLAKSAKDSKSVYQNLMLQKMSSGVFSSTLIEKSPTYTESGCMPVFNLNKMCEQVAIDYTKTPYRYAGGHIHLGWNNPTDEQRIILCRLLDYYFSHWSIENKDKDFTYGRGETVFGELGNVRKKDYGIEYRTPSNSWFIKSAQHTKSFLNGVVKPSVGCLRTLFTMSEEERIEKVNKFSEQVLFIEQYRKTSKGLKDPVSSVKDYLSKWNSKLDFQPTYELESQ